MPLWWKGPPLWSHPSQLAWVHSLEWICSSWTRAWKGLDSTNRTMYLQSLSTTCSLWMHSRVERSLCQLSFGSPRTTIWLSWWWDLDPQEAWETSVTSSFPSSMRLTSLAWPFLLQQWTHSWEKDSHQPRSLKSSPMQTTSCSRQTQSFMMRRELASLEPGFRRPSRSHIRSWASWQLPDGLTDSWNHSIAWTSQLQSSLFSAREILTS